MCISPGVCNKKNIRAGVTLLEVIVALVISVILAGLGWASWSWRLERESAFNAKAVLGLLLQAEQNYFTWRNRYAPALSDLEIDDPNRTDRFYEYNITAANETAVQIRALRRSRATGFFINETGVTTSF
jgi:prepilin-type N-terminal cleavage/methylation domain-containing protein